MDLTQITARQVRSALDRYRSARSLAASRLTDLDLVRQRLRDEDIAPPEDGLEWALVRR